MRSRIIEFGDAHLDTGREMVFRGATPLSLSPKAFKVLCELACAEGKVVTKAQLLDAVWPRMVVGDAVLHVCISEIRRALGDSAKTPKFVQTVQRRGYRLLALVGAGKASSEPSGIDIHKVEPSSPDGVVRDPVRHRHAATEERRKTDAPVLASAFDKATRQSLAAHHLVSAAESALAISAYDEALDILEAAQRRIESVPSIAQRSSLELAVQLQLANVWTGLRGPASSKVEAALVRAEQLAFDRDDMRRLFQAKWGRFYVREQRAAWTEASALADDLSVLAQDSSDPVQALQARHAQWVSAGLTGDAQRAFDHADAGLAIYRCGVPVEHACGFGDHDAGVCALLTLGLSAALLGRPAEALEFCEEATLLADSVQHVPSRVIALHANALVHVLLGNAVEVLHFAARAGQIATEAQLPAFSTPTRVAVAWARCALGDGREVLRALADQLEPAWQDGRRGAWSTVFMGLFIDALRMSGERERAWTLAQEVQQAIADTGETVWECEILRQTGLLQAQRGDVESATATVRKAHDLATLRGMSLFRDRSTSTLRDLADSQNISDARAIDDVDLAQPAR